MKIDETGGLTSDSRDPETGAITVQKTTLDENGNPASVTITTTDPTTGETKETTVSPASAVTVKEDGSVAITGEAEVTTTTTDTKTGEVKGEPTTTKIDGSGATEGNEPTIGKTGDVAATPGTKITPVDSEGNDGTPATVGEGQTITLPADKAGEITTDENGTPTLPAGTTVGDANGNETTLDTPSAVSADGSMTGEEFSQGDTTLTGENGEKISVKKNADGSIDAPANTNVDAGGTTVTTTEEGQVKVNADGSMDVAAGVTLTVAGEEVTAAGTTTVAPNGTASVNVGTADQTDYSINGAVITYDGNPDGYWFVADTTASAAGNTASNAAIGELESGDGWFPEYSEFFTIDALGANAEPADGVTATVTMPSSKAGRLNKIHLASWNTETNAWEPNGTLRDGETAGTVAFDTTHFSTWVLGDEEAPHFYATVALGTDVEDLYDGEDAETAAYPGETWATTPTGDGLHHTDGSGNPVYDLAAGDEITISVRPSIDIDAAWVYVQWDSDYLQLDAAPAGWVRMTADNSRWMNSDLSSMEYYAYESMATLVDAGESIGDFVFTVAAPETLSATDLPIEIPFEFFGNPQVESGVDYATSRVMMHTTDTLVRLADLATDFTVEVVQYGDNTAQILVYSKAQGTFTYDDATVLSTTNQAFIDVTGAGYIFRSTYASTSADDEAEALAFYGDGTTPAAAMPTTAPEGVYVYSWIVNGTRLLAAGDGWTTIDASHHEIEADVASKLTYSSAAQTEAIRYTDESGVAIVNMDVNGDGNIDLHDKEAVRQMMEGLGSDTVADEVTNAAERTAILTARYDNILANSQRVALRCDFIRREENEKFVDEEVEYAAYEGLYLH